MKRTLIKIGQFFRLLDDQNKLSITNIAVMICLFKIYISPDLDITAMGTLLLALLNYGHKKHLSSKQSLNGLQDIVDKIKAK